MHVHALGHSQSPSRYRGALQRLWSYFWGDNEEGIRMKETVPLVVAFR
jgi:hypothetical protein